METRLLDALLAQLRGVANRLGPSEMSLSPGLTDDEVERVEHTFHFRFPPDLKALLQRALPVGPRFPNWRSDSESKLCDWLDVPRDGILFDIENNGFWLDEWGLKPPSFGEQRAVAEALISHAPVLIPIYAHRMIPDEPCLPGNPVFSVHQTDIIYYGFDLVDYFQQEFHWPALKPKPESPRPIRFWEIERFTDVRWADGPCEVNNRGMPF